MNELGEFIKSKRLQLELSPTRMAKRLGISTQRLGYYERGRNKPKIDFVQKWKSIFNEDLPVTIVTDINSDNILSHENYHPQGEILKNNPPGDLTTALRIIEKQQETIHYLTTGQSQGGSAPRRKKASG